MNKREERELKLLMFLTMQELAVKIIFMPDVLLFEHSIVRPN